jgi:hypothetical protein
MSRLDWTIYYILLMGIVGTVLAAMVYMAFIINTIDYISIIRG